MATSCADPDCRHIVFWHRPVAILDEYQRHTGSYGRSYCEGAPGGWTTDDAGNTVEVGPVVCGCEQYVAPTAVA